MIKLLLPFLAFPGMTVFLTILRAEGGSASGAGLIFLFTVIAILILLNGLYVSAEFAIIGVRPTQLEPLVEEGNKQAKAVLGVVESRSKQDQYIATAQLGITVASLGLAQYAEPQIAYLIEPYIASALTFFQSLPVLANLNFDLTDGLVHTLGFILSLGFLTYLHVVFGEMVPKSLALSNAADTSMRLSKAMRISSETVLKYPVRFLNAIGNGLLRIFRIPPAEGHARVLSIEELELLVAESAQGGLLNEDEQEMINNIFDFSERTVEQVMTPRTKVEAISSDVSRQELLSFVTTSRHSRFPVYENDRDHIIGILHLKDIIRQTIKLQSRFDLRLILRSIPAVPEDLPVQTLLAAFKRQKLHMAIVLDEFGGMAGIVTLEDLVEEVVGEVRDEFDQEHEPYEEIGPGVVEVSGAYLVDDFDDGFWGVEDLPDVETVGGLVVSKLGRPPRVGDVVHYGDDTISLEILSIDGRAVNRVRIEFPSVNKDSANENSDND